MFGGWMIVLAVLAQAPPASGPAPPQDSAGQAAPALKAEADLSLDLSGSEVDIQVMEDGTLVIQGTEEDVAALERIIDLIDVPGVEKFPRVFRLESAQAATLAPVLQSLIENMIPAELRRPEDEVHITAEPRTNMLLVVASERQMRHVQSLVQDLDMPSFALEGQEFHDVPVEHMKASEAGQQLISLLQELQAKRGDTGPLPVNIVPNDRTNSLLISAPKSDMAEILRLLRFIDVELKEGMRAVAKMVIIPLLRAEAQAMAKVLEDMIEAQGRESGELREQIRRLRLLRAGAEGELEELPEIDLEQPIRILADEGTNSIIVGTSDTNIEPFTELVQLLDTVPIADEMSIRIFPLQHADASDVKDLLESMFTQGQKLPDQPGRPGGKAVPTGVTGKALVYNVSVVADTRTNTVVVSGRMEQILLAQELLNKIDVPDASSRYPFRIVKLEHAGVSRIAEVLEDIVAQRREAMEKLKVGPAAMERERVFLVPELRSNSLIISANDTNYEEFVELIEQLDGVGERLIEDIRIINLDKATASDLVDKIEALWERRAKLIGERADGEDRPVVVADTRSNSLVIASSPEDYESIRLLVEKLEAQPLSPMADIHLVQLKYNDAGEVSSMLEQLFEERLKMNLAEGQKENPADRVAVLHDSATNALIMVGSRENYELMLRLIRQIDIDFDVEGLVRIFFVKNTDATSVADRIQELFDKGIVRPAGQVVEGKLAEQRDKVAIVADARTNSIIVSASLQNFHIIERLIARMDDPDAPDLLGHTRVFALEHADAVKLADMLTQMFEGIKRNAPDQNVFLEPTIIPDNRSNTLIVAGSKDALSRAEEMIKQLDVKARGPTAVFKVYTLTHAAASKLMPMMSDLFENRQKETAEIDQTPTYFQADESSNSLIVSASQEEHRVVQDLLKLLDVPSSLEKQLRIFPLRRANAEDLAERLTQLFEQQPGAGGGGAGAGRAVSSMTGVGIEADLRTNSLVVRASPTEMDNIAKIIQRLDTSEPSIELMIRHVHLKQAGAEEMAEVLTEALQVEGGRAGAAGAGRADQETVFLSYIEEDAEGAEQVRKLLRQDVTIVPDPRTNSLLLVAPPESVVMLERLIRKLDAVKPEVAKIRVFTLRNANAEDMLTMLEEVFQTDRQAGGRAAEGEQERELVLGAEGGAGGRQTLAFTVDARTNSIVAAGTDEYLDLAETLIRELDARDVGERVSRVYAIRYGKAEDLADALSSFIDEQTERYERAGDQMALQRQVEREVSVVPVEDTNSLLLDFDPRRESEIMALVRELDRPPPQVMIQVLLAEVSLDERLELGIEFAGQDLLFTETGNDFDFVAGTDVGASGTSALGGFSFTITGEDFNFLLRMLQTEGSLEVLSRPQILVQDNQEANISVADNVPFVRGVTVSDTGATQTQIEYEEVGIILDVTPHINPDGFVTLEIAPEISNLSASSITITEGLTAPIFNSRSAETTVTVRDGETVVIGGMIQTREEASESKVPIVGDIPGVGVLFRSQTKSRRKSELLIVLTPRVVLAPEDARALSLETRDIHGQIPDEQLRSPLFQGLQLQPGEMRGRPDELGEQAWPEPGPEPTPAEEPSPYTPKLEIYGPGRAQAVSGTLPLEVEGQAEWARSVPYDRYPQEASWSRE